MLLYTCLSQVIPHQDVFYFPAVQSYTYTLLNLLGERRFSVCECPAPRHAHTHFLLALIRYYSHMALLYSHLLSSHTQLGPLTQPSRSIHVRASSKQTLSSTLTVLLAQGFLSTWSRHLSGCSCQFSFAIRFCYSIVQFSITHLNKDSGAPIQLPNAYAWELEGMCCFIRRAPRAAW